VNKGGVQKKEFSGGPFIFSEGFRRAILEES